MPFLRTQNIGEHGLQLEDYKRVTPDFHASLKKSQLKRGDLLLGRVVTDVMKCGIVPAELGEANCANMILIRPKEGLLPEFLNYMIKSPFAQDYLLGKRVGSAQQVVNTGILKDWEVPAVPLEEQRRIVAVLDAAFEGLTRAKDNAEANLQNARELFEAQLKAQFDPLPANWEQAPLAKICSKIGSGATPRGGKNAYRADGVSLIRSMNVHDREFRHKDLAHIDDDQAEKLSIVELQKDDVLLNITGASVARCAQVDNRILPARVNQHVAIIRPFDGTILPHFLCYELTSEPFKKALLKTGEEGGATRQAITKAQIQALEVSYPKSQSEQQKVAEELAKAESLSITLEAQYRTKLTDIANLRQSLLQKAFAGELT